ncbi:hypothetical protein [Couchioplanes caeruleus]|uniref:hypothetical protein n=1 Tax=Couchioplanes caeruleus TaxID=56438 RepID=UPI000AE5E650
MAISMAQLKSLPIEPHAERVTWNYTDHPRDRDTDHAPGPAVGTATERRQTLDLLADSRLTGMNCDDLALLAARLTPKPGALREERLHRLRGGPAARQPRITNFRCSPRRTRFCWPFSTCGT